MSPNFEELSADPKLIDIVQARMPAGGRMRFELLCGGHRTGAAVYLSVQDADGPRARLVLDETVDPEGPHPIDPEHVFAGRAGTVVPPPHLSGAWTAHCGTCGKETKATSARLLQRALEVIVKEQPHRISITGH